MQLVGMMVGAFLGLLIFGEHSWGFYGSVFIGGLLGVGLRQKAESSAGPKSPLAITSDLGAVPPPIPTVEIENSTKSEGKPVSTEKSRVIPSLILVTVLLTVLGSLAWTTLASGASQYSNCRQPFSMN